MPLIRTETAHCTSALTLTPWTRQRHQLLAQEVPIRDTFKASQKENIYAIYTRGRQYQFGEGQYQYQYLQRARVNTQYQYQYSELLEVNTQYQYQYLVFKKFNTNTNPNTLI